MRGKAMAPSGLTAIWVPLKVSLARAVELGWLTSNPARSVELPNIRPPRGSTRTTRRRKNSSNRPRRSRADPPTPWLSNSRRTPDVPIALHVIKQLRTITRGRSHDAALIDIACGNHVDVRSGRNRVWRKAVRGAGLHDRQLSPKTLRHTAASMAIAAGADLEVAQRMVGCANASMTSNTSRFRPIERNPCLCWAGGAPPRT